MATSCLVIKNIQVLRQNLKNSAVAIEKLIQIGGSVER